MVEQCPALKSRIKPVLSQKRLIYKPLGSFYQVLSAEAYTKHGLNVHAVVFDELHAQPNRQLYDVMTHGSGDARKQPLYFLITTAGNDTNSICYEVHQKARDILDGRKVDPTFYPVIYGAEEADDWTSHEVWAKANPSLGITVDVEKLEAACESAKQNPAEENLFRQLRLCQWVKQAVRWMPMEKWDKCAFAVNPEALRGRACYGGLDLSSTTDITAFVLVFPPDGPDDKYTILPFFWIPEENMELRVRRDHVPYDVWEKQGYLKTTEGNVVHYGYIESFIEELPRKFFAYTPCFRREAGSHRAEERGMVRGHQFNKVEMFQYTRPEDSDQAFEELVGKAERLVRDLGFHFRTVKLAAGDCSASMARTYDIEIQIPSMNGYKEVSSVSNARDYQARRGNIRFRREATGKPEFVHTLNGSGLATSRIFPAMVEQNQRADGSVVVPEVLRKYLGGIEIIEKK